MKLLPSIQLPQLPPVSAGGGMTGMDSRLPPGISLPFSPTELLWRYGPAMNFPPTHPPPSPFLDFKTHLPASLGKFASIFVSSTRETFEFYSTKGRVRDYRRWSLARRLSLLSSIILLPLFHRFPLFLATYFLTTSNINYSYVVVTIHELEISVC